MPTPVRVVPLVHDLGATAGHRLVALSLEVYDEFADLRFARLGAGADRPLPRRIPPVEAWTIHDQDGFPFRIVDCVGRGGRSFSNGEVRIEPAPGEEAGALEVAVTLRPDAEPLTARLSLTAT